MRAMYRVRPKFALSMKYIAISVFTTSMINMTCQGYKCLIRLKQRHLAIRQMDLGFVCIAKCDSN